jgi:hypothetical protein
MNLDLRVPMGLMFTFVGAILAAFGLATRGSRIYSASLGIDVNLWWGLVLFIFGLTMYFLGQRGEKQPEKMPPEQVDKGEVRRGH